MEAVLGIQARRAGRSGGGARAAQAVTERLKLATEAKPKPVALPLGFRPMLACSSTA
jgi:hypothetical protein